MAHLDKKKEEDRKKGKNTAVWMNKELIKLVPSFYLLRSNQGRVGVIKQWCVSHLAFSLLPYSSCNV